MPNIFLDHITPVYAVTGATIKDKQKKVAAQKSRLLSTLNTISRLLSLSFVNTIERRVHKKAHTSTTSADAAAVSATAATDEGNTDNESIGTDITVNSNVPDITASPRRRRKGRATVDNANAATPRRGADTKRQRRSERTASLPPRNVLITRGSSLSNPTPPLDHPSSDSVYSPFHRRPTTEFLGWRRLHLEEILRLGEGDHIIVIIPGSNRYSDTKEVKEARQAFRNRVLGSIIAALPDEFIRLKQRQRTAHATKLLEKENGIKRNGQLAIELPCKVKTIANQDDYLRNITSAPDVKRHVAQDAGIELKLLDYMGPDNILLKW